MTAGSLERLLDGIAPFRWAFPGDKVGLLIGARDWPASRVACSLDPSLDAVRFALNQGCGALVAHHPIIWNPLKSVGAQAAVVEAVKGNLAVFGYHTNWDCAPGGVNDSLAGLLGIQDPVPFGTDNPDPMLKMAVFVPRADAEAVRLAAVEAGAGRLGRYSGCTFSSPGEGAFTPEEGASPAVGTPGMPARVPEIRLEALLPSGLRPAVEAAVRKAHPYEEPAIDFYALEGFRTPGVSRVGALEADMTLAAFSHKAEKALGLSPCTWGPRDAVVRRAAVCGGAGSGEWQAAQEAGADVLVAGEVRHDHALAAREAGFWLIEAGHHQTEHPGMAALTLRLQREGVDAVLYEPEPGAAARPWSPGL